MMASEEPWVRAPVVGPGAWKRSASIRMQRCSIAAVRGYSAWSMKLRCRLAAMIRCAPGSIQVVTNVARLRAGSPSSAMSSDTSRKASVSVIPPSGNSSVGTSSVRKRLPNRSASLALAWWDIVIRSLLGSTARRVVGRDRFTLGSRAADVPPPPRVRRKPSLPKQWGPKQYGRPSGTAEKVVESRAAAGARARPDRAGRTHRSRRRRRAGACTKRRESSPDGGLLLTRRSSCEVKRPRGASSSSITPAGR